MRALPAYRWGIWDWSGHLGEQLNPKSRQTIETSHQFERASQKGQVQVGRPMDSIQGSQRWKFKSRVGNGDWAMLRDGSCRDASQSSCSLRQEPWWPGGVLGFFLPSTIWVPTSLIISKPFSCFAPECEETWFLKHRLQIPAPSSSSEAGEKDPSRN